MAMSQFTEFAWALRRNGSPKNAKNRARAEEYLSAGGWVAGADAIGSFWTDPTTKAPWELRSAVAIQLARDAKPALELLGYGVSSGPGAFVHRKGRTKTSSLAAALRQEGLL